MPETTFLLKVYNNRVTLENLSLLRFERKVSLPKRFALTTNASGEFAYRIRLLGSGRSRLKVSKLTILSFFFAVEAIFV